MARIKTTHVGSLPRSKEITDLVFARENGVPVEEVSKEIDRQHEQQRLAALEVREVTFVPELRVLIRRAFSDPAQRFPIA